MIYSPVAYFAEGSFFHRFWPYNDDIGITSVYIQYISLIYLNTFDVFQ